MKKLLITLILVMQLTQMWALDNTSTFTLMPYNIFKTVKLPYSAHSTTKVFQDSQGMIWIGTYHGIIRYDGYNTKFYLTERTTGINNFSIMSIVQIDNQHLLVGSQGGMYNLNIMTGDIDALPKNLNQVKSVRTMMIHGDNLWIGTNGEGLWTYNLSSGRLTAIRSPHTKFTSIYALCPVENTMYIGSLEGLRAVNMKQFTVRNIAIPNNNKFVNSLLWNQETNTLFVGTEGKLCLFHPHDNTMEALPLLQGNVFKSLAFDKHDNLLVGTDAGLYVYNLRTKKLRSLVYNAFHQSISNNVIWDIHVDKDENVWLATDNGVTIMEYPTWYTYYNIYELTHSEYGNTFTSILQDSQHRFWLAGENGLLKLNNLSGQWKVTNYNAQSTANHLKHNRVRHIYEDKEHDIWIATDGSIARYNPQSQQFEYYHLFNSKGESGKWAYSIYEDNKGKLWIATYSAGMFAIDKKKLLNSPNHTFWDREQSSSIAKLKGNSFVRQIVPGDKDEIWLCCPNFIIRKNCTTGKEERINARNEVAAFCNHSLWISTQEGDIMKYNPQNKQFKTFKVNISNGPITCFVQENNNLWFSCTDGIYTINTLTDEITFRDLPNVLYMSGIYCPNLKRIIWGGENCISTYDVTVAPKNEKVYITCVSSNNGKRILLFPKTSQKIHLHTRDDVTFELSTLQYTPHQEAKFYYQLGDNKNWQSLKTGSNELTFAHIASGTYTLRISATNPEIDKNAKVTTYQIVVPSPWYASSMAIFVYIIIITLSAIGFARWYKRRNQKLMEQHEKERSMELLRQKNEFFINMSHELKTPLSLIIAPLSNLIKANQQNNVLKRSLTSIQKNALQLNMLIHKVMEFKNKDFEDEDSLIRSHIDINSLARNCLESFSSVAIERNIMLNFHSNNQEIWMNIDTLKMQSAITNLISNAIKFVKNDSGIVNVSVHQQGKQVCIEVEDNGKGIPDKDAKMIFIRFYQANNQGKNNEGSGIGLYLVKKYVEMHDGTVMLSTQHNTKFTITLPLDGANAIPVCPVDDETKIDEQKHTIMIIDDNREIVSVLSDALHDEYNCIAAFDGKDGFDKIEKILPHLIIADQMMPVMNGFQLVRQLKKNSKTANIPIIMLTAKDDATTELQSIKLGVDIFLTKPFDIDKIKLQISRLIHKKTELEKAVKIEAISNPQFEAEETKVDNYDAKLMEKITSIIEKNMEDEAFNVTALANELGFSQKQLYRKVKQITGITPIAYVKSIKMKKAAFLLKDPQYSITEVMYMIGYSNMSYFIKCFSSEYQMTPKQYAEKNKN